MKTKGNIKPFIAVLYFGILLTFSQTISAQETKKTSEEKAETLTELMKEKLMLDDNQYAKVYDINLKYIKKNAQLQSSSSRRLSKLKTLRTNQDVKDKELKNVLNSEQYKVYQQLKEKLKEELKENRKKQQK
jgi:hypothetical protein